MPSRRRFLTDVALSLAATAARPPSPLLSEGRSRSRWINSRRAILIPHNAGIVERTAAEDLQAFIERHFSRALPVQEGGLARDDAIVLAVADVGTDRSSAEAFELTAAGGSLRITGSDPRGVLQGVFWFERWLTAHPEEDASLLRVERTARFRFRAALPYYTEAGLVTDDYLRFVASSGHNMLYLEFDPFKKYIDDPLPFPISQIFRTRDFVNSTGKDRLVQYVNEVFARATRYGLDGYLYVMEPWGGDVDFVTQHPEAIGRNRTPHMTQPLCLDAPVAVEYLKHLTAELVRAVPDLKGIIVMSEDGTTICDDSCPRSKGPRSERRATLFKALAVGGKSVRSDFRVVAYTWWWDLEDFRAVIPALPKDSLVCTRTSTHAPFELDPEWKGSPGDVSLIVDGPGQDFQEAVKLADLAGIAVVDMLPISNGHELITMPSIPAPDRYARRLDVIEQAGGAGWIAYDCGGATPNLASAIITKAAWKPAPSVELQVASLAEETYGRPGAARAVEGWKRTSAAFRWFPIELDRDGALGIRAGATISQFAPLVPFTLAQAHGYRLFPKGPDSGPMENLSQGEWLDFWQHRRLMLDYLPRLQSELAAGIASLQEAARLAPADKKGPAGNDVRAAQANLSTFTSAINLLRFWEQLAAIPGAKTPEARTAIIQAVNRIVGQERDNTGLMLELVKQDRRLFYCACTKYVHPQYISGGFVGTGFFTDRMTVEEMLRAKLVLMETEDFAGHLERAFSGCCVDLINWGVRPDK